MILFKNLTMRNFLSYGNDTTEVDLRRKEPTLITGVNYDASTNNELDSNGAGKSTILIALSICLYDKPIGDMKGAKKESFINNINQKDMLLTVDLQSNKKNYRISRFLNNKAMGGTGVTIEDLDEGKDITPDSSTNANKYIAEVIMNMPHEIFNKIIVYTAGADSYLSMPLAQQREVIEELFSYTELTRKASVLKDKIKDNKNDLKYAKESNEEIKAEAERYQHQLDLAEEEYDDWETERKRKLEYLEKTLKDFSGVDFDAEIKKLEELSEIEKTSDSLTSQLNSLNSDLKRMQEQTQKFDNFEKEKEEKVERLEKKLNDLEISDEEIEENKTLLKAYNKKHDSLSELRTEYGSHEKDISNHKASIEELDMEIEHLSDSNCPYCKQQYKQAAEKLKKVEGERDKHVSKMEELEQNRKELKKNIAALEDEMAEIKETLIFDSMEQINELVQKRDRISMQLEQVRESENPYEEQSDHITDTESSIEETKNKLDDVNKSMEAKDDELLFKSSAELYEAKNKFEQSEDRLEYLKNEENPHAKLVQNLKDREPKDTKDDEIDELLETIEHQEFLLKLLTKKDSFVRKALMDKYLPFLNERLRFYLDTMGLPHKVVFKPDLTTEISQFDRKLGYATMSAGQKARINIALSLAFRDVLQSKHSFINLYILDECLDVGLSNVGIKKTTKLIKDLAHKNKLSMFVISHRDEIKSEFNDILEVELRNGFSTIKRPTH